MRTTEELIHEAVIQFSPQDKPEEAKKYEKMMHEVLIENKTPMEGLKIDKDTIDILYAHAYQLYNSGKYKQAEIVFIFLSFMDPSSVPIRLGIAASMHKNKEYREAIDAYQAIVPMDPYNPMPLFHAADCWLELNEPLEAAGCLHVARAQAWKNPEKYPGIMERADMSIHAIVQNLNNKVPVVEAEKKS